MKLKFLLVLLMFVPHLTFAGQNQSLDPVLISPGQYQLKFENDHVRVVEYEILPGEKEKWHVHPAKVAYVLSGGKLKITTENGESFIADEQEGEVRWLGAVGKHYGENVGESTIRVIFVEIKNIDQKQQDLNSYLKEETKRE